MGWEKKEGVEYNLRKARENNPQGASENILCQLKKRKKLNRGGSRRQITCEQAEGWQLNV